MNENYRHQQLLGLLESRRMLSTQDIIEELNISPATARRDINKLHDLGKLKKVRNGAESVQTNFTHHHLKTITNSDEKQRIAAKASELCKEGESVLLTCGSTMMMLGNYLSGRKLQILTNYLPLANYLIEHNHQDIVIMGGQYNKDKAITLSFNPNEEYAHLVDIMFTSGKGFTEDGLYKTDMIIANSEQQMSAHSAKYVVLLDSTKLGKKVGMLFTKLDEIDVLITGQEADPEIVQALREKGLEVILA